MIRPTTLKSFFRFLYLRPVQINAWIELSKLLRKLPVLGKAASIICDNFVLYIFGTELTSSSIDVKELVIGHSTGVVLGGNGLRCTGTLNLSSGVVFGRRYGEPQASDPDPFFDLHGNVSIGANSVVLGPVKIVGPTIIGALTLVTHDITEPGVYVGIPAKRLK